MYHRCFLIAWNQFLFRRIAIKIPRRRRDTDDDDVKRREFSRETFGRVPLRPCDRVRSFYISASSFAERNGSFVMKRCPELVRGLLPSPRYSPPRFQWFTTRFATEYPNLGNSNLEFRLETRQIRELWNAIRSVGGRAELLAMDLW